MKKSNWHHEAIRRLESDYNRSADTTLLKVPLPHFADIDFYLKDESSHITGSLKYRLAYYLFIHGICNGSINENTTIVEASSGNTALSEAYFANLLGLQFITVVPKTTSLDKIRNIERYNGTCIFVEGHLISVEAERIAKETNGFFMDQFANASKVSAWKDESNIASSIYHQLEKERFSDPEWFVMSAGTGGTSGTIGRHIKWAKKNASLCVPDPEDSIFYDFYRSKDKALESKSSKIEGIGRPYYVESFCPDAIDMMVKIPDTMSIAAMHYFSQVLNKDIGPSSGVNIMASLLLISEMKKRNKSGSIVSVICDKGEFYKTTYHNEHWLMENDFGGFKEAARVIDSFYKGKYLYDMIGFDHRNR